MILATRRMFSQSVVTSAKFLRLNETAKLLYFYLGLAADDEGIAEGLLTLRTIQADEAELDELANSGFIQFLDRENLIVFITHWSENNSIRADRFKESHYHALLAAVNQVTTSCQSTDNQTATDCPHRIGKGSIVEDRVDEGSKTPLSYAEQYESACKKYGKATLEDYLQRVETYQQSSGKVYADKLATACLWIERDIADNKLVIKNTTYDLDEYEEWAKTYTPKLSTQESKKGG